jgi:hypothetical protein
MIERKDKSARAVKQPFYYSGVRLLIRNPVICNIKMDNKKAGAICNRPHKTDIQWWHHFINVFFRGNNMAVACGA